MFKLNFIKNLSKKFNKNTLLIGAAVIGIVVTGALIFISENPGQFSFSSFNIGGLSNDEIAKKTIDYINNQKLANGTVSLVSVSEESGLIKVKIKIDSNEFDSYVTKDGKLLFPQAFKMEETAKNNSENQGQSGQLTTEQIQQTCDAMEKTDKPILETYVVSKCPFGLQMQRVLADVAANAPDLAQNMFVRYIGAISNGKITSMHGDEEAQENLRQICIRDEQRSKYWNYISCHIKVGEVDGCLTSANINKSKLSDCMSDKNRGLVFAKADFDLADKYNDTQECKANPNSCAVAGSPALILNGASTSEFNFGGRTSEALKSMICCASKNKSSDCSKILNTAKAADSFSETYAGSGDSGNSGNNGTNCAPAQ